MSKRGGESVHRGKPIVKKRKGVKIRSMLILDSDDDNPPSNASTEYIRWVKTRVTTSGQVGQVRSVTTSSVAPVDLGGIADNPLLEVSTEHTEDTILQDATSEIRATRRKRGKANDSVSFCLPSSSCLINGHSDQDAIVARCAAHRA